MKLSEIYRNMYVVNPHEYSIIRIMDILEDEFKVQLLIEEGERECIEHIYDMNEAVHWELANLEQMMRHVRSFYWYNKQELSVSQAELDIIEDEKDSLLLLRKMLSSEIESSSSSDE